MHYYIKKLGSQELGSVRNGKAQRGRYIYISKDKSVLELFPTLSAVVRNDSSIIPIIPLYSKPLRRIWCNFIYHNDKFVDNKEGGRNEYRIYIPASLEQDQILFEKNDYLIFRSETETGPILSEEEVPQKNKLFYLYRCADRDSELYKFCESRVAHSEMRGGHALYNGTIREIESQIKGVDMETVESVIDDDVEEKVTSQVNDAAVMASLFNSVSFRDFVLRGYEYKCAITGSVIRYKNFMNLEAAHIWPRSHDGLYLPNNGIAMSRDMHWAFDKGMFTIDDNYQVKVHPKIDCEYLMQYDKKTIGLPKFDFFRPNLNMLKYHQENIYGLFLTSGSLTNARGYHH